MTAPRIRTLVVDDEPMARQRVRTLLSAHDGFEVVGEPADGIAALQAISTEQPGLVFLDVQMPGLDGLGVAGRLPVPPPLIVFVTAFDRFAATAFTLDAADYLLKPYDRDRFAATVARVRRRLGCAADRAVVPIQHLVATSAGQVRLLPVSLVERIDAAGNYGEVTMAGGARHLVREPLSAILEQLPDPFVRVHRSTVIRADRVASIEGRGHGDATIVLMDGSVAPLSRRFRPGLAARLAAVGSR